MHTLKQKTQLVQIELPPACEAPAGAMRPVTIRRMAWKPAQEFLGQLAKLLAATGSGAAPAEGGLAALAARLPELLGQSETLVAHLLRHSTDLAPALVDELDAGIVLELVRLAVEVNLDAEVKNSSAGIVAAVVGPVPAPAANVPTT